MDDFTLKVHTSIASIDPATWQQWFGDEYPFLRWEFLHGLEKTGCTTAATGWQPCHFELLQNGEPVAALPAYLKDNSFGEYVFDWSWAEAWNRAGLSYYPKLVTGVPFTPATGPRLWRADVSSDVITPMVGSITEWLQKMGGSSWHWLFIEEPLASSLGELGMHRRHTTQFHWFNRGFRDFDDFLDTFSSRKRKNVRKERAAVPAQGVSVTTQVGAEISSEDWAFFHRCYQTTYAKRSGHSGYLTADFFLETCPSLGDVPVMVIAKRNGRSIAAALYFKGADTLFGRYWGCLEEHDALHFEACYYSGIEFCIAHGLSRFDPGAQGEHKIQRGFEPILTHSSHWIGAEALDGAVAQFTTRERLQVQAYCEEAKTLLPFKKA